MTKSKIEWTDRIWKLVKIVDGVATLDASQLIKPLRGKNGARWKGLNKMWPFRRKPPHKADEYFRQKFMVPMGWEAFCIVIEAHAIRHRFPDLSGPELVRLVYWGASGAVE